MNPERSETTQLLLDWAYGSPTAFDDLTPRIYKELRRMAAAFRKRERRGGTLNATALVHEVYLKLIDVRHVDWKSRAHFFAACAQIMRRILVDEARKRSTAKHGGGLERFDLDDVVCVGYSKDRQLVALDDALTELQQVDLRKARLVELRYFGGLSLRETAAAFGVSEETVTRDLRLARAWLLAQISVVS